MLKRLLRRIRKWLFGSKPAPAPAPEPVPADPPRTTIRYEGPADQSHYELAYKLNEQGFELRDLILLGDRDTHQQRSDYRPGTGMGDEFGHGLVIVNSSGIAERIDARDCWGDGVIVCFAEVRSGDPQGICHDVTLRRIVAENNRRNGLAVIGVDGLLVEDSIFRGTHGNPLGPGAGVDFEPDTAEYPNRRIVLRRVLVEDNQSFGIICDRTDTTDVLIEDSVIRASKAGWALWLRFGPGENIVRRCKIYGPVTHLANVVFEDCEFFHDGSYTQTPYAVDVNNNEPVRFLRCRVNGRAMVQNDPAMRLLGANKEVIQ